MYTLEMLCKDIRMPEEVTGKVLAVASALDMERVGPGMKMLRQQENWEQGQEALKAAFGEDPHGFQMLTCMLLAALECRADYETWGLSHEIYVETMACFSRFVNEHMTSFGCWGFDRGFWTVRQVSGKIFRIGQLEYEMTVEQGQKVISIHIPSDASLALPGLRKSWEEAKVLLNRIAPEYAGGPWICGSWLLSPNLKDFLPEDSRILGFQRNFTIMQQWQDEDFKEWLYGRVDISNEDLPEKTLLQRKVKQFLLGGGAFLSAGGVLSEDPFLG